MQPSCHALRSLHIERRVQKGTAIVLGWFPGDTEDVSLRDTKRHHGLLSLLGLVLVFWLALPGGLHAQPLPEIASRMTRAIHTVRLFVEQPHSFDFRQLERLRLDKLEVLSNEKLMTEFVKYAYGPGFLHIDAFRTDLTYIFHKLQELSSSKEIAKQKELEALKERLRSVSFDKWSSSFSQACEQISPPEAARTARMNRASSFTLSSQDAFLKATIKPEYALWLAHSALSLWISVGSIYLFKDLIDLNELSDREQATFVIGTAVGALGTWALFMDHYRWIDPFRKLVAKKQYKRIIRAWERLARLYPEIAFPTMGAAAGSKLVSTATYADAMSDAAFEALLASEDEASREQKFRVFRKEIAEEQYVRAMRITDNLKRLYPGSHYANLAEAINDVYVIRKKLALASFQKRCLWLTIRVVAIYLSVKLMNKAVDWYAPEYINRWPKIPAAFFGVLGVKKLHPFFFRPEKTDKAVEISDDDESALQAAIGRVIDLDPSGEIAASLVAHAGTGRAAAATRDAFIAEVLSRNPTGQLTARLFEILANELAQSSYSGKRVKQLSVAAFALRKSCADTLLETAVGIRASFKGEDPTTISDPEPDAEPPLPVGPEEALAY